MARRLFPVAMLLAVGLGAVSARAADPPIPPQVVTWIGAHAVATGPADAPLSPAAAAIISRVIDGASVLAIGEPEHGAHEPLDERNRIIRYLVEHEGFTAVALESGLAQGRRIDAYIMGGPGDPAKVARGNLNWGFDKLSSNIALIRWLRAWNAVKGRVPVRFYGADISGGDTKDSVGGARLALDDLAAFFRRHAPARSAALRRELASLAPRFTPEGYAASGAGERARLRRALADARQLLKARPALTGATAGERDWAREISLDAERLAAVFAAWPRPGGDQMPGLIEVSRIRDRTMADHLLWALRRSGPAARIVTFAHDGHVGKTPILNKDLTGRRAFPRVYGENLYAALGDRYRVLAIVTAASGPVAGGAAVPQGSIERAFLMASRPRALLALRGATLDPWWSAQQSIGTNYGLISHLVPTTATDAILLLEPLTCDPPSWPIWTECTIKQKQ